MSIDNYLLYTIFDDDKTENIVCLRKHYHEMNTIVYRLSRYISKIKTKNILFLDGVWKIRPFNTDYICQDKKYLPEMREINHLHSNGEFYFTSYEYKSQLNETGQLITIMYYNIN